MRFFVPLLAVLVAVAGADSLDYTRQSVIVLTLETGTIDMQNMAVFMEK